MTVFAAAHEEVIEQDAEETNPIKNNANINEKTILTPFLTIN
jgi:hypothetical protein